MSCLLETNNVVYFSERELTPMTRSQTFGRRIGYIWTPPSFDIPTRPPPSSLLSLTTNPHHPTPTANTALPPTSPLPFPPSYQTSQPQPLSLTVCTQISRISHSIPSLLHLLLKYAKDTWNRIVPKKLCSRFLIDSSTNTCLGYSASSAVAVDLLKPTRVCAGGLE